MFNHGSILPKKKKQEKNNIKTVWLLLFGSQEYNDESIQYISSWEKWRQGEFSLFKLSMKGTAQKCLN